MDSLYDDLEAAPAPIAQPIIQLQPAVPNKEDKDSKLVLLTTQLENEQLKKQNTNLKLENEKLKKKNAELQDQNNTVKTNISQLFITAKQQLREKDQEIEELREQVQRHEREAQRPMKKQRIQYAPPQQAPTYPQFLPPTSPPNPNTYTNNPYM
jgi:DNA anti-recombination protein RmuC